MAHNPIKIYEAAVIGGGITGAGIIRDLALRGVDSALIEKGDFSSGTTGTCMGLLHGGPKYIQNDPKVTEISCRESGIVQMIAPFLVFRVPFLTPIMPGDKYPMDLFDAYMALYDKYGELKNAKPHVKLTRAQALKLEPKLSHEIVGAVSLEEWGVDVFRLTILNALDARDKGASIHTYTEVTGIDVDRDGMFILHTRDTLTGEKGRIQARILVNAGGPWAGKVAKLLGVEYKLRPTKGIHLILDRRVTSVGISAIAMDGHNRELLPHESTTLIGCTDDDFMGDPDDITAHDEEIRYLMESLARVVPSVKDARIIRVMAGARPILFDWGKDEGDLSRDFEVRDHGKRDGVENFITVCGGKMVIYRHMAEKAADKVIKLLGKKAACVTDQIPLAAELSSGELEAIAGETKIPPRLLTRMHHRHGSRLKEVLPYLKDARERTEACICEPVMQGEVRYSIQNEMVRIMDDLRRRLRIGAGPCQGAACGRGVAVTLGEEKNWSPGEIRAEWLRFAQRRWKGKIPILAGAQLAQEELNQAAHSMSLKG